MTGNPLIKDYQVRLSADFILPEVVEEFKDYFEAENSMYTSLVNYINHTIVETSILGYTSPSTDVQYRNKGNTSSFNGTLHPSRKIKRTLSLTFSLKRSFMNYMVMYRNCEVYDETMDNDKRQFYGDIFLDIYDSNGNLLYTWIYQQIQINEISEIRLDKKDKGIGNKSFTVDVTYNKVLFKSYLNKKKADLKEEYKHNFHD